MAPAIARWSRMNRRRKRIIDDLPAPTPNDEYLLYQTLIGSFPLGPTTGPELQAYCARIEQYMLKAVREAKVNTSWLNPNEGLRAGRRAVCARLAKRNRT
jgi:(1->4)-alpha-D-glucan 1-alpha-D-glucosylmutase